MIKKTNNIWNDVYKNFEKGKPPGIQYPTEAFVVFVSNLQKNKKNYFEDLGKEFSARNNFKGKALDIGFGSLSNLLMLKDKGFQGYGAEISKEAVKRGKQLIKKKKLEKKIFLKVFRNSQLPYKSNYFDLVSGFQSIYYNLNLEEFIKSEIYRILKPGGKFIFSFFAKNHSYMKYINKSEKNIYYFNKFHPNKRLHQAKFYFAKDTKDLKRLFKIFKKVNVFYTKSNQTVFNENWWYVVGEK